jgi:hypothetical protein
MCSEQSLLPGDALLTGPRQRLTERDRNIARDRSLRSRCHDRLIDSLYVHERAATVAPLPAF